MLGLDGMFFDRRPGAPGQWQGLALAFRCVVAAAAAVAMAAGSAQTADGLDAEPLDAPRAPRRADDFGIVVNQTFTQSGQEFYRRFTDYWREKPDFEAYTLSIVERPSRRFGNQVSIVYGQKPVFVGNLPVKIDAIRNLSADAVEKVHANIITMSLKFTGDRDPDMANDEL